jgi:hypothetical protein
VDNVFSEKQQRLLTVPLYDSWAGPASDAGERRTFAAMANVGLFFHPDEISTWTRSTEPWISE